MNDLDVGLRLRDARRAAGLTVQDIQRRTKIPTRIIDAIERDDLSQLPQRIFVTAFVRACAREVGLDPDETLRDYMAQFAPVSEPPTTVAPEPEIEEDPANGIVQTLAVILLSLGIAIYGLQPRAARQGVPDIPQTPPAPPTLTTRDIGPAIVPAPHTEPTLNSTVVAVGTVGARPAGRSAERKPEPPAPVSAVEPEPPPPPVEEPQVEAVRHEEPLPAAPLIVPGAATPPPTLPADPRSLRPQTIPRR